MCIKKIFYEIHSGFSRAVLSVFFVLVAGCAQSTSWKMPWESVSQSDRLKEKYGLTADQRIEKVQLLASKVRRAEISEQESFTETLVQSMLAEHDPRVRIRILGIASTFETPAAFSICRGALEDPDSKVRMAACDAWGKRGGTEAVELLSHRYQTDSDIDVRLRAVRMLGDSKAESAIPVLAKALEDPDPAVQYRAVTSLKNVSGRDLGNDVNRWRNWAADPSSEPDWSMAETLHKVF